MHSIPVAVLIAGLMTGTAHAQDTRGQEVQGQEAQPDSDAEQSFGEIVVTAQKREQSVQDVPITMSAFGAEELRELRINEASDIAYQVPQVQVQTGFNQPYFAVRGIGINEFSGNTDSPVAVHFNEVYLSRATQTAVALFDVERIEVLKGPQGTLFGRNTTGGSVNIYARAPTSTFTAGAMLTVANYGRFDTEGFISGPITDTLAARASWTTQQATRGIATNLYDGSTMGRPDRFAGRFQLQWTPSSATLVNLMVFGSGDHSTLQPFGNIGVVTPEGAAAIQADPVHNSPLDYLCPAYLNGTVQADTPGCVNTTGYKESDNDPLTTNSDAPNRVDNSGIGAILRVEQDLGFARLTALGSYMEFERVNREDSIESPYRDLEINWYNKIKEYTLETRLASQGDGPFSYVMGLYYQRDDLDVTNTAYLDQNPSYGLFVSTVYTQTTDAYAAFGQAEYQLTPWLSLAGGLRYSREDKSFVGATPFEIAGMTEPYGKRATLLDPIGYLAVADMSRSDENLSWMIGLNARPNPDLLIYGHVERGFKSGGFNGGFAFSSAEFSTFEPERITAYELGFKSNLAGDRLTFNGAVFHYLYDNPQVNADAPGAVAPISTNADSSKYFGLEAELTWRPTREVTLRLGYGYLDAEMGTFSVGGVSYSGNRPINAPRHSLNALARYEHEVFDGYSASFMVDANYRSSRYLEATNTINSLVDGYGLVNARVALRSDRDDWEVALWVKNITNHIYPTYVNDLPSFGYIDVVYGEPRTYGVTLSKTF